MQLPWRRWLTGRSATLSNILRASPIDHDRADGRAAVEKRGIEGALRERWWEGPPRSQSDRLGRPSTRAVREPSANSSTQMVNLGGF